MRLTAGKSQVDNQQPRHNTMNLVYKITNAKTNKCYIGITTQGVDKRWTQHVSRFNLGERDHKLYQSMRKHGIENFKMDVICCAIKDEHLGELEEMFIKKFNCFNRGYNMTCGDGVLSKDTRKKISDAMIGRKITWYDKILESKKKNGTLSHDAPSGASNKRSKRFAIKEPSGKIVFIKGLREYCRDNMLSHNLMLATLNGKQSHHKTFVLLARFNDHPEREYTQAGGNGARPVIPTGRRYGLICTETCSCH